MNKQAMDVLSAYVTVDHHWGQCQIHEEQLLMCVTPVFVVFPFLFFPLVQFVGGLLAPSVVIVMALHTELYSCSVFFKRCLFNQSGFYLHTASQLLKHSQLEFLGCTQTRLPCCIPIILYPAKTYANGQDHKSFIRRICKSEILLNMYTLCDMRFRVNRYVK